MLRWRKQKYMMWGVRCEGLRVDEVMRSQEEMQISDLDQVEVGTVLSNNTFDVSFLLDNNCESLFFFSFLLF